MRAKYIYLIGGLLVMSLLGCNKMEIIETHENGLKKLACEVHDGQKNGKCIGYFPDGEIKFEANYQSNILHGKSRFFHKNGELHWEVDFRNGIKNGEITYYDDDGRVIQKSNFKNNNLEGFSYGYYSSGNLKSKMEYLENQLHGPYYSYYENGQLQTKASYDQNQMIDFYHYDSVGNLVDHLIKYEIEQKNNNITVYAVNKQFSAFGLRVEVKDITKTKSIVYDTISKDGYFNFPVIPVHTGKIFNFQLYEIDSIENDSLNGIVRSKIEFEHAMK